MRFTSIAEPLSEISLAVPKLNSLTPNGENHTVVLFQPQGQIEVLANGLRNRAADYAAEQFSKFLGHERVHNADLVVTPEYSMPWAVLKDALKRGPKPRKGQLWVLGCESIRLSELLTFKSDLAPDIPVLFENIENSSNRFTSPLAYVFVAPKLHDPDVHHLVVVVQFKTHPMSDADHFELSGLQPGTRIYQFDEPNTIKLTSLICSDALGFLDEQARAAYDRGLILHIQLNPKPRHEEFRRYRDRLLRFQGDQTEILCLNWARDVCSWHGDQKTNWKNIAGSAWYLRPDRFDSRDQTITSNHRRGLYYTWLAPFRYHALFFNYQPAVYVVETSKVFHHGQAAVVSHRKGPVLRHVLVWDDASKAWETHDAVSDEFSKIAPEAGQAQTDLAAAWDDNPLAVERILALGAGSAGPGLDWHKPQHLDSCMIDGTEVIRRVTFCQDTDVSAKEFRVKRLRRCKELALILQDEANLPSSLKDLRSGFKFNWSIESPHQNVISDSDERATAIYMSEDASSETMEAAFKNAAENLHKSSSNLDDSIAAKHRLALWYRDGGQVRLLRKDQYIDINKTDSESEFDIARTN